MGKKGPDGYFIRPIKQWSTCKPFDRREILFHFQPVVLDENRTSNAKAERRWSGACPIHLKDALGHAAAWLMHLGAVMDGRYRGLLCNGRIHPAAVQE